MSLLSRLPSKFYLEDANKLLQSCIVSSNIISITLSVNRKQAWQTLSNLLTSTLSQFSHLLRLYLSAVPSPAP